MMKRVTLLLIFGLLVLVDLLVFVELGPASLTPWLLLIVSIALFLFILHGKRNQYFLVWSDDYSVGVEAMDRDHQKMIHLINNLKAGVLLNTGESFERHTLQDLVDYTQNHLKREEALLKKYGYPDFEAHKAQHDQIIKTVEQFSRKYEEKGSRVLPEIADFLTRWLDGHINGTDKEYSAFLNEHGVK